MFDPYTNALNPTTLPVEIIPAILPRSLEDLRTKLSCMRGVAPRVQVDAVDGIFAKHATWPYTDTHSFEKIVREQHGLPFWDEFDFEFDLMTSDPVADAPQYVTAGALSVILHAHSDGVLSAFQHMVDMREEFGDFTVKVGVAILPTDQPDILEQFEAQFDSVQVMGIDHVGRQGEPFNHQAVFLLERLRRRYPQLLLQVDGGVNAETIPALVRAGANRLVVGSAIFRSEDPAAAYTKLLNRARTQ